MEYSQGYADREHPILVEDSTEVRDNFSHYTPLKNHEEDEDCKLAWQLFHTENQDQKSDREIALSLQSEFDCDQPDMNSSRITSYDTGLSVVDESLELLDPLPNICELFMQYNDMFFDGKLAGVEVIWSPRMTRCAGVCVYEGFGGLCSVRLSEPLLKLRPRRDLVQTLLHEMIHAYLFVTQNNKDCEGHGPEFQKHMNRINKQTGANITIYHSFHDEVGVYQQHWWRCDGPCRQRPPFFGFVKRAMNRPPQPHDSWWPDHKRSCGGTFTKIKEPDGFRNKTKKRKREPELEGVAKKKKVLTMDDFLLRNGDRTDENSTNLKTKEKAKTVKSIGSASSDHFQHLGKGHVLGGPSAADRSPDNRSVLSNRPEHRLKGTSQHSGGQQKPVQSSVEDLTCAERNNASAYNFEKEPEKLSDHDEWNLSLAAALARQRDTQTVSMSDMVGCPACGDSVPADTINSHLDSCLEKA